MTCITSCHSHCDCFWCLAQLSLAHAPGVAYTTFACLFVCFGGILSTVFLRAAGDPAIAGAGVTLHLFMGITVIQGQFAWPADRLWKNVRLQCFFSAAPVLVRGTDFMSRCTCSTWATPSSRASSPGRSTSGWNNARLSASLRLPML